MNYLIKIIEFVNEYYKWLMIINNIICFIAGILAYRLYFKYKVKRHYRKEELSNLWTRKKHGL